MPSREMILDVRNPSTEFVTAGGTLPAVDDVSFSLSPGETLGLVGESGCGKSVTSFSLMRLVPSPGRIVGGEVVLEGRDILKLSTRDLFDVRGKRVSMIFQDPADSLNPTVSIGEQVMEALDHTYYDAWRGGWLKGIAAWTRRKLGGGRSARAALRRNAIDLLEQMGIPDPERRFNEYPYMLSGGLLQRCMIAIALASRPALLIADEPTTALDVTIQAQILDLLRQRQRDFGVSIVLITHDLGVVAEMCDRVAVMYAGRVVEQGTVDRIFKNPRHPYTAALLRSVPRMEARKGPLPAIDGTVPNLVGLDRNSCYFFDRCAKAMPRCREVQPRMREIAADEFVACHLYDEQAHALS